MPAIAALDVVAFAAASPLCCIPFAGFHPFKDGGYASLLRLAGKVDRFTPTNAEMPNDVKQ
jgi:hypothetical protein